MSDEYIIDGAASPLSPVGAKLFGADVAGNVGWVSPSPFYRDAMATVVVGNSISSQSKYGGSYWSLSAEIHLANTICGAPMIFKRMTASTRADAFGVYGYSGQTLPAINADLEAQLWTPLATAGIIPDLVVGLALVENDIVGGATVANMQKSVTAFVRDAQARFPGAIVMLCTPRPAFTYNSAPKVAAYHGIRDYMLSLDNGVNVFTARCDGYEDPAAPGVPLSGYTDATVHPNSRGAFVNARSIAAAFLRIGAAFKRPYRRLSNNMALMGSVAASGTNSSGTVPTNYTANSTGLGVFVFTAENPGLLINTTANAAAVEPPSDTGTSNAGIISLSGVTQISNYMQIEIVSGAENIGAVELWPRIADGGGNNFQYYLQRQTNDGMLDYANGDILTFVRPPAIAASGSITTSQNYLRLWSKLAGGEFSVRILSQGVEVVA